MCGSIWNSCCSENGHNKNYAFTFHLFTSIHVINNADTTHLKSPQARMVRIKMKSVIPCRLQSGVNLQVCFVNDSSSDKDSDAEDTRTETSLDTPLSPVVRKASYTCSRCIRAFSLAAASIPFNCGFREHWTWHHRPHVRHFLSRASRVHRCQTETRGRRTRTHWMTAEGSGGCSAGCRRRHGWHWLWPDPWPECRWRWRGRSSSTDAHLWLTWLVSERRKQLWEMLLLLA